MCVHMLHPSIPAWTSALLKLQNCFDIFRFVGAAFCGCVSAFLTAAGPVDKVSS